MLVDGRRVRLRPLTADDEPSLAAVYAALDAADQRRRFSCSGLTPAQLHGLVAEELDHAAFGVVAVCDDAPCRRPVAAGSCARGDDGCYELALAVVADFQRAHLGRAVLDDLRACARSAGIPVLRAFVRRDNRAALSLLRSAGCLVVDRPGPDELVVEVATDATMPPWPGPSASRRVLVEGGGWNERPDVARLRADGYEVRQCPGPDVVADGCPLLATGECRAAEGADLILFTLPAATARSARLLDAHRRRWPGRVVTELPGQ